jgi:hypothetical protein
MEKIIEEIDDFIEDCDFVEIYSIGITIGIIMGIIISIPIILIHFIGKI